MQNDQPYYRPNVSCYRVRKHATYPALDDTKTKVTGLNGETVSRSKARDNADLNCRYPVFDSSVAVHVDPASTPPNR